MSGDLSCKFCDSKPTARGLCMKHYKRAMKDGSLSSHSVRRGAAHNRLALTGRRFGRLTVAGYIETRERKSVWLCACDCGTTTVVYGPSLTSGNTTSCGCVATEITSKRCSTHGHTNSRAYRTWQAMLNRCRNPRMSGYMNYGGRGISVCGRWLSFENFLTDMGDPPAGRSIDRINNDGNYEPTNCRWASKKEQAGNTRRTRLITYGGSTRVLSEWADLIGIDKASLRERLDKWPLEKALTTPPRGSN